MRDWRNCAKEYGELLSRYPADSVARAQRASCLLFLRNIPESLKEMQHAVKMLPNHVAFRINLVLIAYRAGEFQLIEDEVNAMQQPDPRAIVALAYSQIARGMPREATETTERVAAMDRETRGLSPASPTCWSTRAVFRGRSDFRAGCRGRSEHDAGRTQVLVRRARASPAGTEWSGSSSRKGAATEHGHRGAISRRAIFAATGAIDKAEALAAELSKSTEPSDDARVYGKIIEAQIAMKRKDRVRRSDSDRREQRARYLAGTLQSRAARTSRPASPFKRTPNLTCVSRAVARP